MAPTPEGAAPAAPTLALPRAAWARRNAATLAGLLVALLAWLLLLASTGPWLAALQERVGDWAWTLGAGRGDERRLIVIGTLSDYRGKGGPTYSRLAREALEVA